MLNRLGEVLHFMIPSYIRLEAQQIDRFYAWAETQKKMTIEEHDESYGGCCMTSSYVWTSRSGSICDEVKVTNDFTKETLDLTIDDDGVMVCDYTLSHE